MTGIETKIFYACYYNKTLENLFLGCFRIFYLLYKRDIHINLFFFIMQPVTKWFLFIHFTDFQNV